MQNAKVEYYTCKYSQYTITLANDAETEGKMSVTHKS